MRICFVCLGNICRSPTAEGVMRVLAERAGRSDRRTPSIHLLRSFDPTALDGAEVPDPYAGGPAGFEEVLDQCERACAGLLASLRWPAPARGA